jgi:hypothetical protein
MFDTGAITIISKQMAEELKFQKEIEIKMQGSGDNSETGEFVKISSIIVCNSEVRNCATAVMDFFDKFASFNMIKKPIHFIMARYWLQRGA